MKAEDFPILKNTVHGRRLVYLDNAATTQKPQQVIDSITYAYTHFNSNIHRAIHYLAQQATIHHENARHTIAQYINAHSPSEIIFTKGTTDSINMLARSLSDSGRIKKGDEIIISHLEHHSNIVPWQMLCERTGAKLRVIPLRENLTVDIDSFKSMLSEHTKLVSIAHVSNVLGIENPITDIIDLAHSAGAWVMIDAAQSAPHKKIDVQQLGADFLVFSAHKMYGPTGVGVLYGKESLLDCLPPAEGGGEMIDHVSFEHTTYNQLPYKFEAGTPNFIGSYAFASAIDYIQSVGIEDIAAHESALCQYAEHKLSEIERAIIYAKGEPKTGAISFNISDIHPFDIGTLLDQQGVAVRTGHHCAEPLIKHLGTDATIRISFAMYNTKQDIDDFIAALNRSIQMLS